MVEGPPLLGGAWGKYTQRQMLANRIAEGVTGQDVEGGLLFEDVGAAGSAFLRPVQ